MMTYVPMVEMAKTTAIVASNAGPRVDADKNAGRPSNIGELPMIRRSAVRPAIA